MNLILGDQDLFATERGFESFIKHIPDEKIVESLKNEKKSGASSQEIWDMFTSKVKSATGSHKVSSYNTFFGLD